MNEVALELDAFAECVRRNREPEPNGAQGLRDVAIMQAIYQAAREARPVPIPPMPAASTEMRKGEGD
jgi:predicted dehydrogenase